MEAVHDFVNNMLSRMGFDDFRIEVDAAHRHGTIFIHDNPNLIKENLPHLVEYVNHLAQLVARKQNQAPIFFDVNNYRRERETLIVELARAAARKVVSTKQDISLPVMNAYERRLVHVELAIHPDVTTESVGEGRERYVVVRPFDEKQQAHRGEALNGIAENHVSLG